MNSKLLFLSALLMAPSLMFAQKKKLNRNEAAIETELTLPQDMQTFTVNGVSFDMVYISAGSFIMGCTEEQGTDCESDKKPSHLVSLDAYHISKFEVTQELWEAVMGNNPSHFKGTNLPVESVSWDDAQDFIKQLNSLIGKKFRLPTEAEWEFAARGGKKSLGYKYSGSSNLDNIGWYDENSGSKTNAVGTKKPNELGLYGMSGNVWEWCSDWYGDYSASTQANPQGADFGNYRTFRGGGWNNIARLCWTINRNLGESYFRNYNLGFRLAL